MLFGLNQNPLLKMGQQAMSGGQGGARPSPFMNSFQLSQKYPVSQLPTEVTQGLPQVSPGKALGRDGRFTDARGLARQGLAEIQAQERGMESPFKRVDDYRRNLEMAELLQKRDGGMK